MTSPPERPRLSARDVIADLRRDPRVNVVERAFIAQRLGTVSDDLEFLSDSAIDELLNLPTSVTGTIGATRLLERIDALVAREHPVSLDFLDYPAGDVPRVVANVPRDNDALDTASVVMLCDASAPPLLVLRNDNTDNTDDTAGPSFTVDEAERLAYALLRLVELARTTPKP